MRMLSLISLLMLLAIACQNQDRQDPAMDVELGSSSDSTGEEPCPKGEDSCACDAGECFNDISICHEESQTCCAVGAKDCHCTPGEGSCDPGGLLCNFKTWTCEEAPTEEGTSCSQNEQCPWPLTCDTWSKRCYCNDAAHGCSCGGQNKDLCDEGLTCMAGVCDCYEGLNCLCGPDDSCGSLDGIMLQCQDGRCVLPSKLSMPQTTF